MQRVNRAIHLYYSAVRSCGVSFIPSSVNPAIPGQFYYFGNTCKPRGPSRGHFLSSGRLLNAFLLRACQRNDQGDESGTRQFSSAFSGNSGQKGTDTSLEINENEIEEQFVRGSGPGGQKINKSSVCVVLKHLPSGIIVRCQETRSQMKNRELARKLLQRKLEEIERGEESEIAREASRARARKAKRRRKSVTKHFKSRRDRLLLNDID